MGFGCMAVVGRRMTLSKLTRSAHRWFRNRDRVVSKLARWLDSMKEARVKRRTRKGERR
jgi:hypothetical protein